MSLLEPEYLKSVLRVSCQVLNTMNIHSTSTFKAFEIATMSWPHIMRQMSADTSMPLSFLPIFQLFYCLFCHMLINVTFAIFINAATFISSGQTSNMNQSYIYAQYGKATKKSHQIALNLNCSKIITRCHCSAITTKNNARTPHRICNQQVIIIPSNIITTLSYRL